MSVATHLTTTASTLLPSAGERESITRSITTLRTRLTAYFGTSLTEQLQFGSSTRGTMLTRRGDAHSDVDYMVVFDHTDGAKPQTLVDRLRRFAEFDYSSSEIFQSSPTLVLNLNHIRFELVPAYRSWGTLYIPAPASSFLAWTSTDPTGFNGQLEAKNASTGSLIKPLIRVLKYWNARSGYVYESYGLEQRVVGQWFWGASTLRDYFYSAVDGLPEEFGVAQWRLDKIRRAKTVVANARTYEARDMPATAEGVIAELLPAL